MNPLAFELSKLHQQQILQEARREALARQIKPAASRPTRPLAQLLQMLQPGQTRAVQPIQGGY